MNASTSIHINPGGKSTSILLAPLPRFRRSQFLSTTLLRAERVRVNEQRKKVTDMVPTYSLLIVDRCANICEACESSVPSPKT